MSDNNLENNKIEEGVSTLEVPSEVGDTNNAGRAEAENLLDRLLYKGVLPRYAFPTDVTTFYVFNNEQSTRYKKVFQFAPSQGLTTALTQYAPGRHVWIDGRLWQSGAIYHPIRDEISRAWENRRLYFECSECEFARTIPRSDAERGEVRDCPACRTNGSFGGAKWWLRPPGFAHPSNIKPLTSPEDQPARSYATRAKLTTSVDADTEWERVNEKIKLYSTREHLLVTNRGPRNEGYNYCTHCGLIESTADAQGSVQDLHFKPEPNDREQECQGGGASYRIVLGTDFPSDILLVSLSVEAPLALRPGMPCTETALRTICEALTFAATRLLNLEYGELQAEFRPALSEGGSSGLEAEIYLYDTLPGGAGFSTQAGRLGMKLFIEALAILKSCPDNCDRSCYRCLRSYKNKFEHDLLDRRLGAELLRYLIYDEVPHIFPDRLRLSTNRLLEDLRRQDLGSVEISENVNIQVEGIGQVVAPILITRQDRSQIIISITHPLTSNCFADERLNSVNIEVIPADEILVSRHLPAITSRIIDKL